MCILRNVRLCQAFYWVVSFPVTLYQLLRNKIINHRKLGKYEKENLIYRIFLIAAIVASFLFNSKKDCLESLVLKI